MQNLTQKRTYAMIDSIILDPIMAKTLTATQFRAQLYSTLDEILQSREPIWIERKGEKYKLTYEKQKRKNKFANLKSHHTIIGNPDDLIDIKVGKWTETKNL